MQKSSFLWPSAKTMAKNIQMSEVFSIFPNFKNDHSFYKDKL